MRVLVMTPVYPHSASPTEGLFNEEHALALTRRGIKPTIVVCKPWFPGALAKAWQRYRSLACLLDFDERFGIPIVYARYLHVPNYCWPRFTVSSCARSLVHAIAKLHRVDPFDVVQVHNAWPVGLAAPLVAETLARPFVLTLHIQDEPRLYETIAGRAMYRRMFERASAVITVGHTLRRFAQNLMAGLSSEHLRVIPNGVDLYAVAKALGGAHGGKDGWGHIVSVANLWPIKGFDFNLRALARLDRMGVPWKGFTIVGDGPERMRLRRLARELGILERVHFKGKLPHGEALEEIVKADIFSLPSWQEAFGVAYLEAMASGKPVIGCWGQGAEDIIRHEKDGLLVRAQDVEELTEAMRRLVESPGFSRQLGESARSRAKEFTWEQNSRQYVEVYLDVISSRRSPDIDPLQTSHLPPKE